MPDRKDRDPGVGWTPEEEIAEACWDHFAGLAMQSMCRAGDAAVIADTVRNATGRKPTVDGVRRAIAFAAYELADAMMAERAKRLAVS